LAKCAAVVEVLEGNQRYLNLSPQCEPQLGRRGLYAATGGAKHAEREQLALLWVLNLSDGDHALLDIAERAHMPFTLIRHAADELLAAGLLGEAAGSATPILQ
jgi:aminopeptidase-like protein